MNMLSPCLQSILLFFCLGKRPPINFHVCVLLLKIIHTISLLQNLLTIIRSSPAALLCNKELSVYNMVIKRAEAITAAAKAASTSRENEKRRKSAARKCEWCKSQSEDR
jgi:hypothetical protein